MTPAQAAGNPDHFITDWPVQGPTDEGIRAADCWWAQNRLPAVPHCVDCQKEGHVMVPGWSRSSMACPGSGSIGNSGGLGESIAMGGVGVAGFALGAAPTTDLQAGKMYTLTVFATKGQDPVRLAQSIFESNSPLTSAGVVARLAKSDVPIGGGVTGDEWSLPAMASVALKLPFTRPNMPWQVMSALDVSASQVAPAQPFYDALTKEQRAWILNGMVALNDSIVKTTGTSCPNFAKDITHAAACFQLWHNTNFGKPPARPIRADGVVDEDTLCSLVLIATKVHPEDFSTPFPDPGRAHCLPPCPSGQARDPKTGQCVAAVEKAALSTGAMVGMGAAGVVAVGGIIYAVTRGGGARRSRRR